MLLKRLFRRAGRESAAAGELYARLVKQARRSGFYDHAGIPDTLDGRFELVLIHLFLVLHRLKGLGAPAPEIAQGLYDAFAADLDNSLREVGVGDLSVGKHLKRMLGAFHGRVEAYESGLAAGDAELEGALRRNLYGTVLPDDAQVSRMASYLRREAKGLAEQPSETVLAGIVEFGPAPGL